MRSWQVLLLWQSLAMSQDKHRVAFFDEESGDDE